MAFSTTKIVCCTLLMSLASFSGFAQQQQWWFDIEVIVYKRNISPDDISEQFDSGLNLIDSENSIDIIYDFIHPDLTFLRANLPVCFAEPIESDFPEFTYQYDESLYTEIAYQTQIEEQFVDGEQLIDEEPVVDGEQLVGEEPVFDEEQLVDEQPVVAEEITNDVAEQLVPVESVTEELAESNPLPISLFSRPLEVPDWQPPRILENHACAYEPQYNPKRFIAKVPKLIDGVEWQHYRQPYLLAQSSLELKNLAKDIGRKQGLTTLLHMGWRQQVHFGQDESLPLHLIAGRNYGDEFGLDGKPLRKPEPVTTKTPLASDDNSALNFVDTEAEAVFIANDQPPQIEPNDLISKIQNALDSNANSVNLDELMYLALQQPVPLTETIDYANITLQQTESEPKLDLADIWELDGKLRVFLRYMGRTPYLHIDGQLDYRAPIIETSFVESETDTVNKKYKLRLQSFEFQQLRRVISKQLHYFDHPLFGLLVQIRRYDLPPPDEEVENVE